MIRICFVCLGNICRSPTAEAVMRALIEQAGLADSIEVDSAGTGDWHVGEPPDARSQETGRFRGYALEGRARQVTKMDFADFDYLVAMDRANHKKLLGLAPDEASRARVHLFRSFDAAAPERAEVPDPYYGGPSGFDEVLDICERAGSGMLVSMRKDHDL